MYLSRERAGGSPYCLDPASEALRATLPRLRVGDDTQFDTRALARDIRFFARLLSKVYSGYSELSQRHDVDVDRFFASWVDTIEAQGESVSFAEGFVAGFARLARWHRDRHLMPVGGDLPLSERPDLAVSEFVGEAPDEAVDLSTCEIESDEATPSKVVRGTLRRAQYLRANPDAEDSFQLEAVVAVSVIGPPPEALVLKCPTRERRLIRRQSQRFDDDEGPVYSTRTVGETTIIRIRRFWGDEDDLALLARLPAEYLQHTAAKRVVFDVRGNGGGDDSYLFEWIFQATREPWSHGVSIDVRAGLAGCGSWNALVLGQIVSDTLDTAQAIAARQDQLEAMSLRSSQAGVLDVDDGLIQSEATESFAGEVFVLIDRNTASSGESVPQYLGPALDAHIIGERSAGFVDFGNIIPFVLPHTGLWVQVPTTRFFNEGAFEMVGVQVDSYLDPELMKLSAEALLPVIDAIEAAEADE